MNKDKLIASGIIVAYWSTVAYAACACDIRLIATATVIFGVVLYASYAIDRAQKSRQQLHETIRDACRQSLDELEAWREQRGESI